MWSAVFCLSFISAASAAPLSKFYSFLPHYGNPMPSGASTQAVNDMFSPSHLQAGMTTPISVEILLPPKFPGTAAGEHGTGMNNLFPGLPSHLQPGVNAPISIELIHPGFQRTAAGGQGSGTGFIKYSLPKAPGGKSVEIYYPYDFAQGEGLPHVMRQIPNLFSFNYPPQTVPQQQPPRQAAPPQGNDQPFVFSYPPQTNPQQQPPRAAAPQANDPHQQIQHEPQVPAGQL